MTEKNLWLGSTSGKTKVMREELKAKIKEHAAVVYDPKNDVPLDKKKANKPFYYRKGIKDWE